MKVRSGNDGFTLIELMMVISIIGILAVALIPQFGDFKTAAKKTGIETNIRSVVITISGMPSTDNIRNSLAATMDSMSNPITNQKGVASLEAVPTRTSTKAVHVFEDSSTSWTTNTRYNGAVVVYSHSDFSADVFAIDEQGRSISELHVRVER